MDTPDPPPAVSLQQIETPARRVARPDPDGCFVLGDGAGSWVHGAESRVAEAIEAATDLSDMSDELAELGSSWPAIADCGRERGHLLRGLELHPGMRVLEVGAGCGGVSRFLAERCGTVDALEPNPARARLAARRLADLPGARVIVGEAQDLPDEPAYDLVVLVGVLEYIGGAHGIDERIGFVKRLLRLLLPGGHVVCAIENRLGVAYFAGQPDDHSGLLFQGPEDHPRAGTARTFSRTELESLFSEAGLHPTTLGVFPDYRFARMVFAPGLLDTPARGLAWRVPQFPSPRHPSYPAASILDERRLWRSLVEDGTGAHSANSFLVVAGGDGEQTLWPAEQLAEYYSVGRRRRFAVASRVVHDEGEIVIERRHLAPDAGGPPTQLLHRATAQPFQDGNSLIEVLAEAPEEERGFWLRRYRDFVRRECRDATDGTPFDTCPANVIVVAGELVCVDTELAHPDYTADDVLARGLFLAAAELAERTVAERWPCETRRELLEHLVALAECGFELDVDDVIERQAELVAEIFGGEIGTDAWWRSHEAVSSAARDELSRPLAANLFGARDAGPGLHAAAAEAERLRALLAVADDERDAALGRLEGAHAGLDAVQGSLSWRLTVPLRAIKRRLHGAMMRVRRR